MTEEDSKDYVVGLTAPIEDEYMIGDQLGQPGQFGVAKHATRIKDGKEFAVKIIGKARFFRQRKHRAKYIDAFSQEIKILRSIDHPNTIKLESVYEDEERLYLVMDLCKGGELFERIQAKGSYSEKDAAFVLRQITKAIKYLHEHNIAHCDLKPDNFLFDMPGDDANLKVIDFGMSKFVQRKKYHRQLCGTPYYIAPEVVEGKYNESCDVWSIGVVMFVMLFGFPPFWADPQRYGSLADDRIYQLIRKGFNPITREGYGAFFPSDIPVTDSAKDLIKKMLETNVAKRLTAEEALEHPWLRGDTASEDPISNLVVNSLQNFTKSTKFKQKVLNVMTEFLTDDQLQAIEIAFQTMDKDGDGVITADELKMCFKEKTNDEINQMIMNADIDGDGCISIEELKVAAANRKIDAKEERMLEAFRRLDKDGDGQITAQELEEAIGAGDDIAELISEVDQNGDGVIDYEEFVQAWSAKASG